MSGTVLAGALVAVAHPEHFVLLGVVVAIGLVVFAVSRRRKRHEEQAVDELTVRDLAAEDSRPAEQSPHPAGHHGSPGEQKHHAGPH